MQRPRLGYQFVKGARYVWRALVGQAVGASWTGKCNEMLMPYQRLLTTIDNPDADRRRIATNLDRCAASGR